jgi:hypothetical protein
MLHPGSVFRTDIVNSELHGLCTKGRAVEFPVSKSKTCSEFGKGFLHNKKRLIPKVSRELQISKNHRPECSKHSRLETAHPTASAILKAKDKTLRYHFCCDFEAVLEDDFFAELVSRHKATSPVDF